MTATVHSLAARESAAIPLDQLQRLYDRLGEAATRDLLERSVLTIAAAPRMLRAAVSDGNARALATQARHLRRVARGLHFTDLERVARDLEHCTLREDRHASAAVACRLARLCEAFLNWAEAPRASG
ncbi:MAG: hypothetical protein D6832_03865 [Alphaproteobacteria bacterium]|nr:MAG: hypothetical protein D6832_03865 [Alphaproteobacteria bacterium]